MYNNIIPVKLDRATYNFYLGIANYTERPLEDILSDTLMKAAEIMIRQTAGDAGSNSKKH